MKATENQRKETLNKVVKSVNWKIDALVQEADAYTQKMNDDYEYFFRWEAESMYKVQILLKAYRSLKHVASVSTLEHIQVYLEECVARIEKELTSGTLRMSSSSTTSLAHVFRLEAEQRLRESYLQLLDYIKEEDHE